MRIVVPGVEKAETFYLPDGSCIYRLFGGPLGKIAEMAFVNEPGGRFVLRGYANVKKDGHDRERADITSGTQKFIERQITANRPLFQKQDRGELKAFKAYRRSEVERAISCVMDSIEAHVTGDWQPGKKWQDGVSAARSVDADYPTRGVWSFSHERFGPLGHVYVRFNGEIPRVSYKNAAAGDRYEMEREIMLERLFNAALSACEAYIKEMGGIGNVEIL
jgi:hypothetical protein